MKVTPFSSLFCVIEFSRDQDPEISFAGEDVSTVRAFPTLHMLNDILANEASLGSIDHGTCLVQFGDKAEVPFPSVAFSRVRGGARDVGLIADPYFYNSNGFDSLRQNVVAGSVTSWRERSPTLYWRGSSTFDGYFKRADGSFYTDIRQTPRVVLCERLLYHPACDVGICEPWGHGFLGHQINDELVAIGVIKDRSSFLDRWSKYKFCLDVDGVTNAWGLFEKLLLGICVLKIESLFEQWFYKDLVPWEHYVPVKSDLSDLEEKVEWCLTHDREAWEIATAGQQFALSETFDKVRARCALAIYNATGVDEWRLRR